MSSAYAENTSVSIDRTIAELRGLLDRFGCDQFAFATSEAGSMVGFRYKGRAVRFDLEMPPRGDYRLTAQGRQREQGAIEREWQQGCRARWRSLLLLVKALLVAIEAGLIDFDRAFMHDMVATDGRTIGAHLMPQIHAMLASGSRAPLLLDAGETRAAREAQ